ncbi:MAG TPA: hypothetical protein VJZ27_07775, partial [Aggregatilineales bacterium]|nr:hypothetical protein [Aggregatilineales bacterium]
MPIPLFFLLPFLYRQSDTPVSIVFWHYYADDRAVFWESLVEEFNASYAGEIQIQVQYYPSYDHQHDAILSGLLNGTVPDVALVRPIDAALYQLSGALVDLTPLIAA